MLLIGSYVFYAAWNPPYVADPAVLDDARLVARAAHLAERRPAAPARAALSSACREPRPARLLQVRRIPARELPRARSRGRRRRYAPPRWNIILPVGISFYTFALALLHDRRLPARDPRRLRLARLRALRELLPAPRRRPDRAGARCCCRRSRTAARAHARSGWLGPRARRRSGSSRRSCSPTPLRAGRRRVFATPARSTARSTRGPAVLGFSGQIYYDFSGYSLARSGSALCFGFALPGQFPASRTRRAASPTSGGAGTSRCRRWLRDYLYIPLGGNRGGEWRTYRNLMLTMLLGGLWHGASWMFVLWGGLHGVYLAVERWLRARTAAVRCAAPPRPAIALTLLTFLVVTLTWIPFRSPASGDGAQRSSDGLFARRIGRRWRPVRCMHVSSRSPRPSAGIRAARYVARSGVRETSVSVAQTAMLSRVPDRDVPLLRRRRTCLHLLPVLSGADPAGHWRESIVLSLLIFRVVLSSAPMEMRLAARGFRPTSTDSESSWVMQRARADRAWRSRARAHRRLAHAARCRS